MVSYRASKYAHATNSQQVARIMAMVRPCQGPPRSHKTSAARIQRCSVDPWSGGSSTIRAHGGKASKLEVLAAKAAGQQLKLTAGTVFIHVPSDLALAAFMRAVQTIGGVVA
jgi:hypothetical protein